MPDNEKREACIDDLNQQISWIEDIDAHKFPGWGHTVGAMRQAVALLKAQEPVAPVQKSFLVSGEDEYYTSPRNAVCGACGEWLITAAPQAKYCPQCGRAVKWK